MTDVPFLLGLSGSLRAGSTNSRLVRAAGAAFGPCRFEVGNIRFPLYDGDLEEAEGIPAEVAHLAAQILEADAIVISTPEYNKNLSGVLKNALDWLSRTKPAPLSGKPVAIMSAAAGRSGGACTQVSLRTCLTPLQPRVLPGPEVLIAGSRSAFDDAGALIDERSQALLDRLMAALRAEVTAD